MAKASDNPFPSLLLVEQSAAPATPAAGHARLYRGDDGSWYGVDDAGAVTALGAGVGGGSGMTPNPQTADYTLVLADADKVIELTAATGLVLTVPPESAVAFPVGTVIGVYQGGAGNVSVAAGAGVTIRNNAPLSGQYAEASLRKRATNEWVLTGDLTSATSPLLKDYAEAKRTAGDITLNQTAVTAVHSSLDLSIAANAGDLIEFGISGLVEAIATPVCFEVYTMPSGATVNPFGAGLAAGITGLQGIPGWASGAAAAAAQLSGPATRTLVAGDVASGMTVLRLVYAKANTTARTLYANSNIPLKVWAKNYGPV